MHQYPEGDDVLSSPDWEVVVVDQAVGMLRVILLRRHLLSFAALSFASRHSLSFAALSFAALHLASPSLIVIDCFTIE